MGPKVVMVTIYGLGYLEEKCIILSVEVVKSRSRLEKYALVSRSQRSITAYHNTEFYGFGPRFMFY